MLLRSWIVLLLCVAAAAPSVRARPMGRVDDALHLDEILARAGARVRQFESALTAIISDENYEQHVQRLTVQLPASPTERRMRSEMLFMWLSEERTFVAARNVLAVDGKPVPDSHDRIERVLRAPIDGRSSRLQQLLDEGARFNLGPVIRNIAEPTLALEFLDPDYQPRFTFAVAGRDRIAGNDVLKVVFTEQTQPTVITDRGHDVLSKGTLWIRPSDGVAVRTLLEATVPSPTNLMVSVSVSIVVNYGLIANLAMWVPSQMDEHYVLSHDVWTPSTGIWAPSTRYESTNCVAKYTNYRRFETSGRIIPRPH
jgi:hypothetical protein